MEDLQFIHKYLHSLKTHSNQLHNAHLLFSAYSYLLNSKSTQKILPLKTLLTFLTPIDILKLTSTSRAFNYIIMSPIGYAIIFRYMRPTIKKIKKEKEFVLGGIIGDKDQKIDHMLSQDDIEAMFMTLNSTIMSFRHKLKQLQQQLNNKKQQKSILIKQLSIVTQSRQNTSDKLTFIQATKQKYHLMYKANIQSLQQLKKQHIKEFQKLQQKLVIIKDDNDKFVTQKELLIRKAKQLNHCIEGGNEQHSEYRIGLQKIINILSQ